MGLVKSALFLIAGILPSRSFKELHYQPIHTPIWIVLVIVSFSISGFPLLSGFGAKVLTSKNLLPWQIIGMNIAALGTAISFAKFIFLPHNNTEASKKVQPSFWWAMGILLGGLIGANLVYYEAYTISNTIKPLVTIALGWLAYLLIFKRTVVKIPRGIEEFDHQIGVMSLMLILLFWMAWA
jgi:multicomponent Na+:H+ antiporter subunit D